jgi:nucleoside-diphosphate kinase
MAMVLSGPGAVGGWRKIMGATDPAEATEGTIRKLYGTNVRVNACHGSDSVESAIREISFFFNEIELHRV